MERVKRYGRGAAIVLGLASMFTIFGVYDSGSQPFIARFTMWLITISVGAVASVYIVPMCFERGPVSALPVWLQVLIASVLISVPVTTSLVLMDASDGNAAPIAYWPQQFGYVFFVSLAITTGGYFVQRAEDAAELEKASGTDVGSASVDAADRLLDRLPPRYRAATLYAVSSEDHYLRIHTDRGEELILMRLADAIALLAPVPGAQVHRSWWVAAEGVEDTRRSGGKSIIILKSGGEAPVSRTYQSAARDAGLV